MAKNRHQCEMIMFAVSNIFFKLHVIFLDCEKASQRNRTIKSGFDMESKLMWMAVLTFLETPL